MERKSSHEPSFEPDVLAFLDLVQRLIRELFFRRIASHGGWRFRLLLCLALAYYFPY